MAHSPNEHDVTGRRRPEGGIGMILISAHAGLEGIAQALSGLSGCLWATAGGVGPSVAPSGEHLLSKSRMSP